jgi:hypothetical protein
MKDLAGLELFRVYLPGGFTSTAGGEV